MNSLADEAKVIATNIATSQELCRKLETSSAEIANEIDVGLKAPAEVAIQGINALIQSMDDLYKAENNKAQVAELVAKCKGQGAVVGTRFKALHDQASGLMDKTSKVKGYCSRRSLRH